MILLDKLRQLKRCVKHAKVSQGNSLGANVTIAPGGVLGGAVLKDHSRVTLGASVQETVAGEYTAIGRYTKVAKSELGKFCAISWDCTINATSHSYENLTVSALPYALYVGNLVKERNQACKKAITRNDGWIGVNLMIIPRADERELIELAGLPK